MRLLVIIIGSVVQSTISWSGGSASRHQQSSGGTTARHTPAAATGAGGGCAAAVNVSTATTSSSILDNITDVDRHSTTSRDGVGGLSHSSSSSSLSRGVGRSLGTLGEKLQDWKPASVRRWNTGQGSSAPTERCSNCSQLEKELAQLNSRLKASYSRQHVSLPPASTVQALVLCQPYTLHGYTSLSDKRELLQCAVRAADTAAIVTVLVYCRNTLTRGLFMQELERSPVAAQSYLCYLKQRRQVAEAVEVLLALGRKEEAGLLKYKQCLQVADHRAKVTGLTYLLTQHFTEPAMAHYKKLIKDQIRLLETQKALDDADSKNSTGAGGNPVLLEYPRVSNVYDKPLLTTLYYACMYHWNSGGATTPVTLKQQYGLTDRQFLWGVVRGRARVKHYQLPDQLTSLLHNRSGVLGALGGALSAVGVGGGGGVGALRAALPLDRVLEALKQAGAPDAVLSSYLSLVEPKELRLRLALQHNVRQAVVEAYVAVKDKEGLAVYTATNLPPGSADHVRADTALKTGRWK